MLTLAIQHIAENDRRGRTFGQSASSCRCLPSADAAVRRRDLHRSRSAGEKLELLEFSRKSARIYRAEQLKNLEIKNPERHTERLMAAVQKELRLDRPPRHIECFDNSNLQGDSTRWLRAWCSGTASPPARSTAISTSRPSSGADDYASMRESRLPALQPPDGRRGRTARPHYR